MNERFRLDSETVDSWRRVNRLTQQDLAKKLKVGIATVGRMLGGSVPRWATVVKLAGLMGVEADSLLIPKQARKAS